MARCSDCYSFDFRECNGEDVCAQCGLCVRGSQVLSADMNYGNQSAYVDMDVSGRCVMSSAGRKVATHASLMSTISAPSSSSIASNKTFSNSQPSQTVIDKQFVLFSNMLDMRQSTINLGRNMFQDFFRIKGECFKGDGRRPLICAACIFFASRDPSSGGIKTKEEIVMRLAVKPDMFQKACNTLEETIRGDKGAAHRYLMCFRSITFNDLIGKVLKSVFRGETHETRRRARMRMTALDRQLSNVTAIKNMSNNARAAGIVAIVCKTIQFVGAHTCEKKMLDDIAKECGDISRTTMDNAITLISKATEKIVLKDSTNTV